MSIKKQSPSWFTRYSIHEEIPQQFLDETDFYTCFYDNNFDISLSQHRKAQVSIGFNKKTLAIKKYQVCDLKT